MEVNHKLPLEATWHTYYDHNNTGTSKLISNALLKCCIDLNHMLTPPCNELLSAETKKMG